MNTSRERALRWFVAAMSLAHTAQALDPNRSMSQYTRDRWGAEQGFPSGTVYAIAGTPDGYLWIGAEKGLVRFDGLRFRLFNHADTAVLPDSPILGLTADAEGSLWIRPQTPALLRYCKGAFQNVSPNLVRAETGVTAMGRGQNGDVLLARSTDTLRYTGGRVVPLAPPAEWPNLLVIAVAETADGKVWMGTRDEGLFFVHDGHISAVAQGLPDRKINCLLAVSDRELWIGTDNGVVRWDGTKLTSAGVPHSLDHAQVLAITKDRESNVWVATAGGLVRIDARGVALFENRAEGAETALYEDREGNLWLGSTRGLERLRDSVFVTYSESQGLPSEIGGPLYIDENNRTWFAPATGGLFWLRGTQIAKVSVAGLDQDVVYSITGGRDELWIGRRRGGLTRLHTRGTSFVAETYTKTQGLARNNVYAVEQARDGAVWAGTLGGGVSRFKKGVFVTYTTADGLAADTVTSIAEGSNGVTYFATPNGLSALVDGKWSTYTGQDGLPPGNANCLFADSKGVLWIGTAEGLGFLGAGRIQVPHDVPEALREPVLGVAEDGNGWLWAATSNHVLRVRRDKLLRGTLSEADLREYGLADGLRGLEGVKRHRSVVADSRGRIWLSTHRGVSVVDPFRIRTDSVPAIVHIETVSADGRAIDLGKPARIPAAPRRITFSYSGLSLSVPERVRFRYILDGFDRRWSEPVAARQATYTNLSPGSYRFRVVASNADGVWNSTEAAIGFDVEPAFWQAWWFRLGGALACVLGVFALYRIRLHQLTRQMNVRFEERLAERTRIAQELHDTLLQGFLSASMQLHVAVDRLPADSPARPLLGRVLELMTQLIDEGRNVVRGLRSPGGGALDLEQAFSRARQELSIEGDTGFRIIVDGQPRPLRPVIRDEVYRIGREALANAFRHSRARNIEVELEYAANHLRVLVRDDGCGIGPEILRSGRDGHWGLLGMRERAEGIGARLKVWSRAAAGTEVELSVPGHVAFRPSSAGGLRKWFARLYLRKLATGFRR